MIIRPIFRSDFVASPMLFVVLFFFSDISLCTSISGLYFEQMFVEYNVFYMLASLGLSTALYPPRYKRLG